jgi:hypothetical protein
MQRDIQTALSAGDVFKEQRGKLAFLLLYRVIQIITPHACS